MADRRVVGSGSPSPVGVLRRRRADARQGGAGQDGRPRAGQRRRRRRGAPWVPVRGRGPFQAALAQRALRLRTTRRRRAAPERRGWRALSRRPRGTAAVAAAAARSCSCGTGEQDGCPSSLPCMWRGLPARGGAALLLLAGAPGGRRRPLPSHRRLPLLPPSPSCVALSPASPAGEAGRPWRGKAERPRRTCFPPLLLLPCGGGAWRGGGGARRASRAWARGTEADAGRHVDR